MIEKLYKKENNLFQSSDWLEFQKSYGREVVDLNGFSGVKIPVVFGKSFIWAQKAPDNLTKKNIEDIREAGKKEGAIFIRVEPLRVQPFWGLREVTEKSILSGQKSPKATLVLDISKTEDEILAQMKPKTRYNIRLAAKKGVSVRVSDSPKDVEVFYDLLLETSKRNRGYFPHEKEYYQKMMETLGKSSVCKLFIAEYNKEPLAAILVSFYGEVATYLHGGFSESRKNLMAPYLCQREAIKYAKSQNCNLYDFWGIAETDDPNDPWAGITRFKSGFGGEKVVFPGAFDLPVNKSLYYLLTKAVRARRVFK